MVVVVRQRSCRRVISSSGTRVSHSSTRPEGPRCHHVGRFVGEGFTGCSTMGRTTFFCNVFYSHITVWWIVCKTPCFLRKTRLIYGISKDSAIIKCLLPGCTFRSAQKDEK